MPDENTILTGQQGSTEGGGSAAGAEGGQQAAGGQEEGKSTGAESGTSTGEQGGQTAGAEGGQQSQEAGEGEGEGEGEQGQDEGAPEQYEDFTLPEGMELDPEVTEEFKTVAKEMNLSQEKAQQLIDLQGKAVAKMQEQQQKTVQQWAEDVRKDPEIGGDKFDESVQTAKKALDTYGSDKLKELLDTSGLGNHPEVVRFFAKVGGTLTEDTLEEGQGGGQDSKPLANRMYPNMS